MNSQGNTPVWLCSFSGKPALYVSDPRPGGAEAQCKAEGLGTPASIIYAGYTAVPTPEPKPTAPPAATAARPLSSRRAELALTIYALLRIDWPIGSILAPAKAAARFPSQSALKDFLADVGVAISRLQADPATLHRVVNAQGMAWYHANREKNKSRAGLYAGAESHKHKKERYRAQARRLRKRRAYQMAIGELTASLDGLLPSAAAATVAFTEYLIAGGMAADDVDNLTRRLRRVAVPRL